MAADPQRRCEGFIPGADGRDALLAILGQGDVVGEMALLNSNRARPRFYLQGQRTVPPEPAGLRAVGTHRKHASPTIATRPEPASARRQRTLHAADAAADARLASTLLELAHRFGEHLPDQRILIRHKVSQAELAQLIGAARENVNRQLAEWRKLGVLSRISGYYCFKDAARLHPMTRGSLAAEQTTRV